jgi:hypothetical protein
MTVKIMLNEKRNPSGKLADTERYVSSGPQEGLP